jgi:hypothetical protein
MEKAHVLCQGTTLQLAEKHAQRGNQWWVPHASRSLA